MADKNEAEQAVDLANELQAVCEGRPTAVVYMALSMILGASEARARKPDLDGLMKLVEECARDQFDLVRSN